jgi:hypothetical protein
MMLNKLSNYMHLNFCYSPLVGTAFKISDKNLSSGKDPSMEVCSLTMVLGTPKTPYLLTKKGNSMASIISALRKSLSKANLCAKLAARAQYGQVGVVNTCR